MTNFNDFGLSDAVVKATAGMGFEEATAIQAIAIPIALKGKDIIGQARTGTGKTAAFGIPMIEKCTPEKGGTQGLVIAPTRELAVQVAEEINTIGKFKKIRALPIYGGQGMERQIKALKSKPQIIVATPGRLMDHMRRKLIRLGNIETVVLDEADEMLNMGFREDIETILTDVPEKRQTMLFSATMPRPIQDLARRFMRDPEMVSIKSKEMTVPNTEQFYFQVNENEKFDALCRLLDLHAPDAAIVFGRTKRRVDEIFEALVKRGYSAEAIHGDLTQAKRDSVMRKFKEGRTEILTATDVAARGLDIGTVTHVYNFDIPQDAENYVHRIGRTGRLGKRGAAATLVSRREVGHLELIEKAIKRKIPRKPVPTINEAMEGYQRLAVEKLLEAVEDKTHMEYRETASELMESTDPVSLVAAALKLLTKAPDQTPVKITPEAPRAPKKARFAKKPNRPVTVNYRRKPAGAKGSGGYKKKSY